MSEPTRVNCFVCDRKFERVHDNPMQPYDGVIFQASGNYGSTVFDPFYGWPLVILVCDACLTERAAKTVRRISTKEREIVSFQRWEPGKDWPGGDAGE